MKLTPGEVFTGARWCWVMNELTPRGHLRPLGGRENSRRARPESRSPRRCAHAWQRCLLSAGRPKHIDQGTTNRHARAGPLPQLHMRKGVNRNPSRRPGLAVSDSNLHAVKTGHSESAAFPGYTPRCIDARISPADRLDCAHCMLLRHFPVPLQVQPLVAQTREADRSAPREAWTRRL